MARVELDAVGYLPDPQAPLAQASNGNPKEEEKAFDALEWLDAMCLHVPNKEVIEGQVSRGFCPNPLERTLKNFW